MKTNCFALILLVSLSALVVTGCSSEISDSEFSDDTSGTFGGYECTDDCSGHEAGYQWAEDKDISDEGDCGGNSSSFIEGCQTYVEENY